MRTLVFLSVLTGCTGSPVFGDSSDSFTSDFELFSTHLPVDASQTPACIPDDQFIDGIGARSCNDLRFNLEDSTTDDMRLKQASSAGNGNQLTSYEAPVVSKFTSPYLIADSSGNGGISLPQLGGAALSAAFGIFMACFQSLGNLFSPSGTAHSDGARNAAEVPRSGTTVEGKIKAPPTESDISESQDRRISPCPVETYAHRQLALCDIGIQSVQYSELDDMFILRDPTVCKFGLDSFNCEIFHPSLG